MSDWIGQRHLSVSSACSLSFRCLFTSLHVLESYDVNIHQLSDVVTLQVNLLFVISDTAAVLFVLIIVEGLIGSLIIGM